MMRDPELMIDLLNEMAKDNMGQLIIPMVMGMSDLEQRNRHHVELLVDAGHAKWMGGGDQIARITNAGYDFLEATRNPASGEKARAKFLELFHNGVPYARAAQAVVDLVAKTMGA